MMRPNVLGSATDVCDSSPRATEAAPPPTLRKHEIDMIAEVLAFRDAQELVEFAARIGQRAVQEL